MAQCRTRRSLLLLDFRGWEEEKYFSCQWDCFLLFIDTNVLLSSLCCFMWEAVTDIPFKIWRSSLCLKLHNCIKVKEGIPSLGRPSWRELQILSCWASSWLFQGCPVCWLGRCNLGLMRAAGRTASSEELSHCSLINGSQTSCPRGSQLGSLGGTRWGVKEGKRLLQSDAVCQRQLTGQHRPCARRGT